MNDCQHEGPFHQTQPWIEQTRESHHSYISPHSGLSNLLLPTMTTSISQNLHYIYTQNIHINIAENYSHQLHAYYDITCKKCKFVCVSNEMEVGISHLRSRRGREEMAKTRTMAAERSMRRAIVGWELKLVSNTSQTTVFVCHVYPRLLPFVPSFHSCMILPPVLNIGPR